MKESFACLIVSYPNKFGLIDQFGDLSKMVHNMNALLISYADPFLLSVLKSPIDYEADIVCGEAQSLGLSLNFGGPYLGYLTAKKYLVRKMPGRIVGATTDNRGQRAFVLTLQAREQHIRRERANSNICSNQSLLALQATIYMSSLGKNGLQKAASNAIAGAHYLHDKLIATALFKPSFVSSFGQETTLKYQLDIHKLNEKLMVKGYLGPQPINDHEGVFFVSEMKTKDDIDQFITAIEEISHDLQ
jgi:glycine dehydrogenase subunit 1